MLITSVTKIDSRRQKVILDNEYVFSLYNSEIRKLNIEEGRELSLESKERIENDILYPRAKDRALYILGSMDKTEKQLKDKLKDSFYPDIITDRVVDFLKEYGYIDDMRYTEAYIKSRKNRSSKRRIECELMKKGVAMSVIKECYEMYDGMEEAEALLKLLEKPCYREKLATFESRNKVIASMLRRGFTYDLITRCINEITDT